MKRFSEECFELKVAFLFSDFDIYEALRKFVIQDAIHCSVDKASRARFNQRLQRARESFTEAGKARDHFLRLPADDRIAFINQWWQDRIRQAREDEQRDAKYQDQARTVLNSLPVLTAIAERLAQEGSLPEFLNPSSEENAWTLTRDTLQEFLLYQFRTSQQREQGEKKSVSSLQKKSLAEATAMIQEELERDVRWSQECLECLEQAQRTLEAIAALEREFAAAKRSK